jgi:hypothetical protein
VPAVPPSIRPNRPHFTLQLGNVGPERGQREIRKGPNRKNDTRHSRRMSSAGCRQLCRLEARLLDEAGEEIFVRYKGEPCQERHEFIRDYLDFQSEANEMKVGAD